ncbi:hypothetical protein M5W78_20935 [Paenibacillus larvae]|uniref:hypothetical protein n=1 Tax=Paenibacillus larvae TaxID=1464 RepID=UPI00227FB77F|nr:hypothetical protein [Paenibacillus larvae]MCY9512323.1 hypothetical protein [Paenibacillus larvae]
MILQGDCRLVMQSMDPEQFHTCVTSPPYWGLRDYGLPPIYWPETTYTPMPGLSPVTVPEWTGCLGLEPTPVKRKYQAEKARADAAEERERILKRALWELIK